MKTKKRYKYMHWNNKKAACLACGVGDGQAMNYLDTATKQVVVYHKSCIPDDTVEETAPCLFVRGNRGDMIGKYPTSNGLLIVFRRGGGQPQLNEVWDVELLEQRGNVGFVRPVVKIGRDGKVVATASAPQQSMRHFEIAHLISRNVREARYLIYTPL